MDYDDAVFLQKCRRFANNGVISKDDVAKALIETISDIMDAIPSDRRDEAEQYIRDSYVHQFEWQLSLGGLKLAC